MYVVSKGTKVWVGGKIYAPGEVVKPLDTDIERLLRIGAIAEIPDEDDT